MYGEKIEENDELRLDLIDVKEMYKAQVEKTFILLSVLLILLTNSCCRLILQSVIKLILINEYFC